MFSLIIYVIITIHPSKREAIENVTKLLMLYDFSVWLKEYVFPLNLSCRPKTLQGEWIYKYSTRNSSRHPILCTCTSEGFEDCLNAYPCGLCEWVTTGDSRGGEGLYRQQWCDTAHHPSAVLGVSHAGYRRCYYCPETCITTAMTFPCWTYMLHRSLTRTKCLFHCHNFRYSSGSLLFMYSHLL